MAEGARSAGLRWLLRLAGAGCLLWLATSLDLAAVAVPWRELPAGLVVLCAVAEAVVVTLKFLRWHYLLGLNGCRPPLGRSVLVFSRGMFWGVVSPGRVGEFVKCADLRELFGQSYAKTSALVLLDRLYDVFCLGLGFLAGLALVTGTGASGVGAAAALAFGGALALRVFLSGASGLGAALASRLGLSVDAGAARALVRRNISTASLPALGLTLMALAVMVARGRYLAAGGFDLDFGWQAMLFVVCALNVVAVLPLSLAGIGTNEVALLALAGAFLPGLGTAASLVSFSLACTAVSFAPPLIISGAVLLGHAALGRGRG